MPDGGMIDSNEDNWASLLDDKGLGGFFDDESLAAFERGAAHELAHADDDYLSQTPGEEDERALEWEEIEQGLG